MAVHAQVSPGDPAVLVDGVVALSGSVAVNVLALTINVQSVY